jgi:hypothetical protein
MADHDYQPAQPDGNRSSRGKVISSWIFRRLLGDPHLPLNDLAFARRFDLVMS